MTTKIKKQNKKLCDNCPICLNQIGDECTNLDCGHDMCADCFKRWLVMQPKNNYKCPQCRASINIYLVQRYKRSTSKAVIDQEHKRFHLARLQESYCYELNKHNIELEKYKTALNNYKNLAKLWLQAVKCQNTTNSEIEVYYQITVRTLQKLNRYKVQLESRRKNLDILSNEINLIKNSFTTLDSLDSVTGNST